MGGSLSVIRLGNIQEAIDKARLIHYNGTIYQGGRNVQSHSRGSHKRVADL